MRFVVQMYLWLDTERGMEFRRQVPVRLSQAPWNNDEALTRNISVFHYHHHHHHHHHQHHQQRLVCFLFLIRTLAQPKGRYFNLEIN